MSDGMDRDAQTRAIIQEWVDKQGHDRCWYYPDLFRRLAALHDIRPTVDPVLPAREEFERGCDRFQDEEYGGPPDIVV